MTISRRLIVMLSAAALIGCSIRAAAAQSASPIVVAIEPAVVTVAAGQTVDVAVVVRDVPGLYAFDAQVKYDPAAVQVVDVEPALSGTQVALGLFLDPGFVIRNQADNTAGSLQLAMTQLNPSEAKSGTGYLVVIKLRGVQGGAGGSPLTLQVQLAQRDGTVLPTAPVSGQVQVTTAPAAGPTHTPLPAQGAGTPLPTGTLSDVEPVATSAPSGSALASAATITPQPAPVLATAVPTEARPAILTPLPAAAASVTPVASVVSPIGPAGPDGPATEVAAVPPTVAITAAAPPAVQVTPAVENPAPAPENSSPLGLIALAVLAGLAGLGAMLLVTRQPGR